MAYSTGRENRYAVGIFLCPAAGLISGRKSRILPDISKWPRYSIRLAADILIVLDGGEPIGAQ